MRKLILSLIAAAFCLAPMAQPAPASAFGGFNFWHRHAKFPIPRGYAHLIGHLRAYKFNAVGVPVAYRDMGIGVITNVGVLAMSNDAAWAAPSGGAINTLALQKYMASGTGATAAAATDMALQTWDSISPVTGTIALNSAANSQGEKVTGTISYTGSEAVTEWGLFDNATLSATTGTPWTAGSATSGTATGTPYTASSSTVQGEEQFVFEDTTKSPNIYCLVTSNTSSVVTCPAWYNVTNGNAAGTFPANTDALKIVPVMLDHMVFAAINVINGDSIQFVFSLSLPSGSFIFFFLASGPMRKARRFVR